MVLIKTAPNGIARIMVGVVVIASEIVFAHVPFTIRGLDVKKVFETFAQVILIQNF